MPAFDLTEAQVRQYATAESFRRGEEYHRGGAVLDLIRRGDLLQARVEGSEPEPYEVQIAVGPGGIASAICTCPYDWGGWCKHIVATLLAVSHSPETVEERPTLEALLAGLDRDQLQALLLRLAERESHLVDAIEGQLSLLKARPADATSSPTRERPAPVDAASVRRQVHSIFHSLDRMRPSEAYWHVGGVVSGVSSILDQAWAQIQAGDGRAAISILDAMTQEYVDEWTTLDDSDGEAGDFFEGLGLAWAEAILTADLTAEEREAWADQLEAWAADVADYGIDDVFVAALEAARQGWDYPPLVQALRGEVVEPAPPSDGVIDFGGGLALARLNVLERQGRFEEYLNLARAEGLIERYATMLVRLGRVNDAVDYGLRHLRTAGEALALADALRSRGELAHALRIAEHGMTLDGPRAPLAIWARDLATQMGETERALAAAMLAFREAPDLATYLSAQQLSGERWPERREGLLAHLRGRHSYYPLGPVEVFLHEGLIDDAIAAVEGTYSYDLIERVAAAAGESRPDWVIEVSCRQAEGIMNAAKAQHYDHAVRWLAHARTAYRAAGREAEWRSYLSDLLSRHARKYKLVPMLQALQRD